MLNTKKFITKLLGITSGTKQYNTNNGTLTVSWYRCLNVVFATLTIHTASNWGTGSGNRITCTVDNSIPLPADTVTGVELNGIFCHFSGTTFRAQNNTGSTLSANNNYNPTMAYITMPGGVLRNIVYVNLRPLLRKGVAVC